MTPEEQRLVDDLCNDKKFMNRLAWRVSWELFKATFPWIIAASIGAAFVIWVNRIGL